jgi:transcriptional regulator GlxA family with amidase domain
VKVAIVAFDGFNELDAFVALGLINGLRPLGWSAELAGPASQVTSMNGVTVLAQRPLEHSSEADVVLFAGGLYTRAVAENSKLLNRLQLDPLRQTIGAQCAGTLLLARLGLLGDMPACTDSSTKPWLVEAGVLVVDEPFRARGAVATAGGSMASVYLAAWVMWRGAGRDAAASALRHAAPVGDKDAWANQALAVVEPFIVEPR